MVSLINLLKSLVLYICKELFCWIVFQLFVKEKALICNKNITTLVIVLCLEFDWFTNSSYHRRVWTGIPCIRSSYLTYNDGLCNYFLCKRFAVQTLLWSLEFDTTPSQFETWLQVEVSRHNQYCIYFFQELPISSFNFQKVTVTYWH